MDVVEPPSVWSRQMSQQLRKRPSYREARFWTSRQLFQAKKKTILLSFIIDITGIKFSKFNSDYGLREVYLEALYVKRS